MEREITQVQTHTKPEIHDGKPSWSLTGERERLPDFRRICKNASFYCHSFLPVLLPEFGSFRTDRARASVCMSFWSNLSK